MRQYQESIPIPQLTEEASLKLDTLAKTAAKSEGPDLAEIENEINQIVYRLFDLTPEEIRLVESTVNKDSQPTIQGEHGKTKQKDAFFRRIKQLAGEHPYVSFDSIKQTVRAEKIAENEDTLKEYLGEAVKNSLIFDAGKGWYSGIEKPVRLPVDPSNPLGSILKKRFPLLPHFVWSTQQVNPWMHHLLGKFVSFVYVDADGADYLGEYLRNEGWDVTFNPTAKSAQDFVIRKKSVVVRSLRREIDSENEPTPEGLLVDLFIENGRLQLMDTAEFQQMALNLCSKSRIDVARLQRLLGDRKKTINEILSDESAHYLGIS